jgi:hypothetical protein
MTDDELIKLYETTLISTANEPATTTMSDARKAALRAVFNAGREAELEALVAELDAEAKALPPGATMLGAWLVADGSAYSAFGFFRQKVIARMRKWR